ncbi:MAG: DHH family phosphoesterase [Sphingobacteriales bacterium]|nr:DHH family phosphoesterase [Sphingobacteriales bacterium]
MKSIQEIFPLLKQPKKVVITTHQKPDADAMGSSLALANFLKQFGHTVTVISPTNWAAFLNWMPGSNEVLDYEKTIEKSHKILREAEWLFCLDFNALHRTKRMTNILTEISCTKILIDHHIEPQVEAFDYGYSLTTKCSTCEMIYDVIVESGHDDMLNIPIAECLYAGAMTDTGSFRFLSANETVHLMVADLKRRGLNHSQIHENIYDNFLENRLRFIGHMLLNRMEIYYEYNTALIAISKNDLLRYEMKTGDTEGLVNYPLTIQGIKLAALVIDRDEERKWSFRSKGNFDCNTFARTYFEGGGHFNAAGGRSSESLDQTVAKFKKVMKENEKLLQ